MNHSNLKKRNLAYFFAGYFFISISTVLLGYFLPFYLKEEGLSILQIGTLLTVGMAFGVLIMSLVFSRLQKKIRLRTGLAISSFFYFMMSFVIYVIPTSIGVFTSNLFSSLAKSVSRVACDVTIQHNSSKKSHGKISSLQLIIESFGIVSSLIVSVILIQKIGFVNSALIFSIVAFIGMVLYSQVRDDTRFTSKKVHKMPKIALDLKLILFTEILYWFGLSASFSLVITFLVTDSLSGSLWWLAVLFIALYASIGISTSITRKFLDKTDLYKSSIAGMIILVISALLIIFSRNLYVVLLAMIFEGIGAGIWVPSKSALYWGRTPPAFREVVSGYLNGLRLFFATIGPLVGGLMVTYLGILSPFYLKGALSIVCILVYAYLMVKITSK